MRGLPVNDETLALDVIDKVGPGGHYLHEDHTFDHFKEIWYSDLFDRSVFEVWLGLSRERSDSLTAWRSKRRSSWLTNPHHFQKK